MASPAADSALAVSGSSRLHSPISWSTSSSPVNLKGILQAPQDTHLRALRCWDSTSGAVRCSIAMACSTVWSLFWAITARARSHGRFTENHDRFNDGKPLYLNSQRADTSGISILNPQVYLWLEYCFTHRSKSKWACRLSSEILISTVAFLSTCMLMSTFQRNDFQLSSWPSGFGSLQQKQSHSCRSPRCL